MSCAACSAHIEKAISALPGVSECAVSLLTNSMGVDFSAPATPEAICQAVKAAGYGAAPENGELASSAADDLADTETPKLKKRLIWSVIILVLLMYVSMGSMWGAPLPSFLTGAENAVSFALTQLLLSAVIMLINYPFFVNGFKGLITRSPGMDALVALGSGASFLYSVFITFKLSFLLGAGDLAAVHENMHDLYFEGAAMIVTLITVGKLLEAVSKGRTTDALKSLMRLAPQTVTLLRDGEEITVPVSEAAVGDIFVVRPGESVPVDGIVESGESAVNESALTGESLPADKAAGDTVSAGTLNQSGYLTCRAARVGQDTAINQIIKMVKDASATKAPIARTADAVAGVFVPAVIAVALLTITIWLLTGAAFGFALGRGIAVLVISCPCALGLATPVAIMVGSGMGAKHGILFKTAASLEAAGRVTAVVLDKTGTVTEGTPAVTDIVPLDGASAQTLLVHAASLERLSEHPLSRAVLEALPEGAQTESIAKFEALPGYGLRGEIDGKTLLGGSKALLERESISNKDIFARGDVLSGEGKTPMYFALDGKLLGLIAVADREKPSAAAAVARLRNQGLEVIMLTGDNEKTARAVASRVGISRVIAGVLPGGKREQVQKAKKNGSAAMVGDGINDAPALTEADVGIAIGAGADVAIDAADVVLIRSDPADVPTAISLSRRVLRNIHQNLFWAFFYNVLGIPIAAGALYPATGLLLSPILAAACMSLSSIFVVTNALRLNLFKPENPKYDKPIKIKARKGTKEMTKTITIEGMMCAHCENHVKNALTALEGVTAAEASHETGKATVTLEGKVTDAQLREAVEKCDYKVIRID